MSKTAAVAALAVLMCGIFAAESAFARGRHHHRWHGGVYIGVPLAVGLGLGLGYRSYYSPYYSYPSYYPAPLVIQQQPPVYVEQGQQPAPAAQPSVPAYWYFCADSRAYYPHVKECASGWQRVAPQPG